MIIFWIPLIASAGMLWLLWRTEELTPIRAAQLAGLCLLAAYLQFRGRSLTASTIGLLLQVALGIYLALRWKLSE